MTEPLYKVISSGKPLPGCKVGEMKKNLAAIFKLSLEEIDRRFSGKPAIVKSGTDLKTARKFEAALKKAGAECKIIPLSADAGEKRANRVEGPPWPSHAPPKTDTNRAGQAVSRTRSGEPVRGQNEKPRKVEAQSRGKQRVITPAPKPVTLQYTPLQCRAVTSAEHGLNFNRYNSENIPYQDILLLSVFNIPSGVKFKTKLLFFFRMQKKPLIVESSVIRYEDFPGTRDEDEYASLRNFITMLFSRNPHIIIDEPTDAFLNGSSPEMYRKEEAARSSALGAALDSENLFDLKVMTRGKAVKKPASAAASASADTGGKEQSGDVEGPELSEEECLRLFIGPNADKYLEKFRSFSKGSSEGFTATWHWPAFLVPLFWLLYRKLYLYALGVFIIYLIPFAGLLVHLAAGIAAYYIYYTHVKKSVSLLKNYGDTSELSSALNRDGGVSNGAVYIGVSVVSFVVIVGLVAGVLIPSILKKKQDKFAEMLDAGGMPPVMSAPQGMPPGFPGMPQNADQAMQLAYDNVAMVELKRTCTLAQMMFSEEPFDSLTLEALERYGFDPPPQVSISIVDPSIDSLRISARHEMGSRMFYIDENCRIE